MAGRQMWGQTMCAVRFNLPFPPPPLHYLREFTQFFLLCFLGGLRYRASILVTHFSAKKASAHRWGLL